VVPSVADWLSRLKRETWMSRGYRFPEVVDVPLDLERTG